jgi:bifunctional non-homologous end joining protein LigD
MPGAPIKPMLATTGELPQGAGWAYEFKWDGVRAILQVAGGARRMWARSGAEITAAYPELAALATNAPEGLYDGEVVLLDAKGIPSFTLLAERMHVREKTRAAQLAASLPVTYMIFDVLRLGDLDLTVLPYRERRDTLEKLGIGGPRWAVPPTFADGQATLAAAEEYHLEGVVAKRIESIYRPGLRTPEWIKYKLESTEEFVIGGWRPGVRKIGGLLVGAPTGDQLAFRGRVGGGISAASERALLKVLEPIVQKTSPFLMAEQSVPREDARGAIWVRPEIVVEVKYGQRTPDGRLRFPRFLRLRPDLNPEDVTDAR